MDQDENGKRCWMEDITRHNVREFDHVDGSKYHAVGFLVRWWDANDENERTWEDYSCSVERSKAYCIKHVRAIQTTVATHIVYSSLGLQVCKQSPARTLCTLPNSLGWKAATYNTTHE